MAKAATSDELRSSFEEHLEQTKGHVQRLEEVFKLLGDKAKGKKCHGIEGNATFVAIESAASRIASRLFLLCCYG
jgi:ferritin-like metal-binding protein YciE